MDAPSSKIANKRLALEIFFQGYPKNYGWKLRFRRSQLWSAGDVPQTAPESLTGFWIRIPVGSPTCLTPPILRSTSWNVCSDRSQRHLSAGISRRRDGQERPSCQGRRDNCYGLQQNLLIAKDTMRSLLFVIKSRLAMMGDRAATEGSKTADCSPIIDLPARQMISIIRPCYPWLLIRLQSRLSHVLGQ